ncbi:hypothetical protein Lal_00015122 [Lupinus albus]|nr:hypothetical protein Lal_00015122 [Lupinus albus]
MGFQNTHSYKYPELPLSMYKNHAHGYKWSVSEYNQLDYKRMDKRASKTKASKLLIKTSFLLPPTCNGINIDHTQKTQKNLMSRSSEEFLAQARHLLLKPGSSRSGENLTASIGPECHISRPGETTLAQARPFSLKRESFSIAQEFTLTDLDTCKTERKSNSKTCHILGNALRSGSWKKEACVALSIVEAQRIVADSSCAQVYWLKQQLCDYVLDPGCIPLGQFRSQNYV